MFKYIFIFFIFFNNSYAEDLHIELETEKKIEEIIQKIELHSGTYNLEVVGKIDFSKILKARNNKHFLIEINSINWIKSIHDIDNSALIIFPIRLNIIDLENKRVIKLKNNTNYLKFSNYKNKELLEYTNKIDMKLQYFLKNILR